MKSPEKQRPSQASNAHSADSQAKVAIEPIIQQIEDGLAASKVTGDSWPSLPSVEDLTRR